MLKFPSTLLSNINTKLSTCLCSIITSMCISIKKRNYEIWNVLPKFQYAQNEKKTATCAKNLRKVNNIDSDKKIPNHEIFEMGVF